MSKAEAKKHGRAMCNSLLTISVRAYFTTIEISLHNTACGKLQEAPYVFKILLSVLLILDFERNWSNMAVGLSLMVAADHELRGNNAGKAITPPAGVGRESLDMTNI